MAKSILAQSGIYVIRNTINNRVYVGSTKNFSMRFASHRYKLRNSLICNFKLQESWNQHGESAFSFEVIMLCSEDNLRFYEQRAIDVYESVENGFNVSAKSHSNVGLKARKETKEKMSIARIGNKYNLGKKATPEARKKISLSLIGNKRCLGVKASDEARKRMSLASKGKPKSEQARINMRNALILRHQRAREAKVK